MKKWLPVLLSAFILSACATNNPPVQNLPEITFKHLKAVELPVAAIDIVDQSASSSGMGGKDVSLRLPTSAQKALRQWAEDRLVPVANDGRGVLTIVEASTVEKKLSKDSGVKGFFKNDQSERYDATVEARLDLYDGQGRPNGFATAKAHRYVTTAEDASLLDLEKTWFTLIESLMKDFDEIMVRNIANR